MLEVVIVLFGLVFSLLVFRFLQLQSDYILSQNSIEMGFRRSSVFDFFDAFESFMKREKSHPVDICSSSIFNEKREKQQEKKQDYSYTPLCDGTLTLLNINDPYILHLVQSDQKIELARRSKKATENLNEIKNDRDFKEGKNLTEEEEGEENRVKSQEEKGEAKESKVDVEVREKGTSNVKTKEEINRYHDSGIFNTPWKRPSEYLHDFDYDNDGDDDFDSFLNLQSETTLPLLKQNLDIDNEINSKLNPHSISNNHQKKASNPSSFHNDDFWSAQTPFLSSPSLSSTTSIRTARKIRNGSGRKGRSSTQSFWFVNVLTVFMFFLSACDTVKGGISAASISIDEETLQDVEKEREPKIVSIVVTHESFLSQFLSFEWSYNNYDDESKYSFWILQSCCLILVFLASFVFMPLLIDYCKKYTLEKKEEREKKKRLEQEGEEAEEDDEDKEEEEIEIGKEKERKRKEFSQTEDREKNIESHAGSQTLKDKERTRREKVKKEERQIDIDTEEGSENVHEVYNDQELLLAKSPRNFISTKVEATDILKIHREKQRQNTRNIERKEKINDKMMTFLERQTVLCNELSVGWKHIILGSIYVCFSISLIYLNDYVVNVIFPYSATLTMFHMGTGVILSSLCLFCFNIAPIDSLRAMTFSNYFLTFFPLGLFYAAELYCENESYEYLDISFIQILKPFGTILTYSLLLLLKRESFTREKGIILFVIIFASSIAGMGDSDIGNWSTTGVVLSLCGSLFYAFYLVFSQILLQNSTLHLNIFTQLLCVGPSAFLGLLIYASLTEWKEEYFTTSLLSFPWWLLSLNCLLAFGLNLSILLAIQHLSSLSLILISYTKEILVVLIAWIFIPSETINDLEVEGYSIELIGLATWKYIGFSENTLDLSCESNIESSKFVTKSKKPKKDEDEDGFDKTKTKTKTKHMAMTISNNKSNLSLGEKAHDESTDNDRFYI